jgi:replicative DNA helicase
MSGLVPPHNLDAEAAVISAILLTGSQAVANVATILAPKAFYSDSNGRIYDAAVALFNADKKIDLLSVASWLRDRKLLDAVGGASYLSQLVDSTPNVYNVLEHAKLVHEKHLLRSIASTCQQIAAESYGDVGDVATWVDSAEERIHALVSGEDPDETTETASAIVHRVFAEIHAGKRRGITTGLIELDRILGELLGKQMIVVGARSGVGKTSLAMGIALHVAKSKLDDTPCGVAVFSLEMGREELVQRALFTKSRVDASKVARYEWMSDDDWSKLAAGSQKVNLPNLWIDDRGGITPAQFRAKVRRIQAVAAKAGTPLRLVVLDYAQLAKGGSGQRNQSREQEVADVSRNTKALAKECDIPIIILAQLNKDSDKEKRRPRARDLRESEALYHDADKVVLIHNENAAARAEAYRGAEEVPVPLEAEEVDLIVDKNRGGRTGIAKAAFFPSYTLFSDLERRE